MTATPDLTPFCSPRTVAVVGASANPAKMGGAAVRNLRHFGYPGRIFAVNGRPSRPEADEYETLGDCPERPEAVIVAVAAGPAMGVVAEVVAAEVPALVLVSAGFGELAAGPEGAARAAALKRILAGSKTRMVGPNTAGLADFTHRFVPRAVLNSPDDVVAGPLAIVTQSGALSNTLLGRLHAHGLGVGLCVATGDEDDLRVDHWLAYVATRPDIRTVVCVVESVRDGAAMDAALAALAGAGAGKRILMLQVGGSPAGQAVAATHTGALACDADLLRSLCLRYGGVWAQGIDDLCRLAVLNAAFPAGGRPPGDPLRVLLLCGSGGEAAMLTDAYSAAGVDLPPPGPAFEAFVAERFGFAKAANPFDLTGQTLSQPHLLVDTIRQALDEDVDLVHVALPIFRDELGHGLYAGLGDMLGREGRPLVATLWTAPGLTDASWRTWKSTRAVVHAGSDGVPSALRRLVDATHPVPAPPQHDGGPPLPPGVVAAVRDRLAAGTVTTADATELAAAIGLGVPAVHSGPAYLADPRPGTFYVKGYDRETTHKKAHGLVVGPVAGVEGVTAALGSAMQRRPDARWFVEEAVDAELALMLSCRRDPTFGWAILLGVGGGLTELLDDAVVTVLATHPPESVLAQVGRSRLGRYLSTVGGDTDTVTTALTRLVGNLQRYAPAITEDLSLVEFNPVLIDPATGEGWCVDFVAAP